VTVDTLAPLAPALAFPTAGLVTNVTSPVVSGSCEAGATVTVYAGSTVLCTATCSAGGFSCSTSTLAEGSYSIVAVQTDATGNVSPGSASRTFTIDTTAPSSPTVTAPLEGALSPSAAVAISGDCETGAIVSVYEGAALLCTATCAGNVYACTTAALGEGSHSVAVHQTDAAGNTSSDSAPRSFEVDSLAPLAVVISAPSAGASLSTASPTFSGTCESGAQVTVSEGSTVLCASSCAAGIFSCTSSMLAEGPHSITATQTDATGNVSVPGATLGFNVDTVAPVLPVLDAPTEGLSTAITAPVFSGSCELGTTVEVLEGATVLCSTVCTAAGFSCTSPTLTEGPHAVVVQQTDAAGNVSPQTDARSFTIDTTSPLAAAITAPSAAAVVGDTTPEISGTCETGATVNVTEGATLLCSAVCVGNAFACDSALLSDASHTVVVQQTDAAGNVSPLSAGHTFTVDSTLPAAPDVTGPATGAFVDTAAPVISGTCETGATVHVYEGSTQVCQAVCVAGAFSCTSAALTEGAHTLIARQVDSANNSSGDSGGQVFTIDTVAPAVAALTSPAAATTTPDATPTLSGTCEAFATVQVFEGATLVCQTPCVGGTFSCVAATLTDGAHSLTVTQADRAGNSSPFSTAVVFTVDTAAPVAPSLLSPVANASLKSAAVTFAGTCETGATVQLFEGTAMLCEATCTASVFSCVAVGLTEGAHDVFALQLDGAGNTSVVSTDRHFVIDLTAPAVPQVSTPVPGSFSKVPGLTVSGSCETGATVEVFEGGTLLCQAVCTAGAFSCVTTALTDGEHALTVRQTDVAGNPSAASMARTVTVDTQAPVSPAFIKPAAASFVSSATPVISGSCESGTFVEVLEGAVVRCSATCAGGMFTCTSATLGDGAHTFTVRQTDLSGNSSPVSAGRSFTVDTMAPSAPSVTSPAAAEQVFEPRAKFGGTGEPGSTVTVSVDGTTACVAVVDASGSWTCTAMTALTPGNHAVTATATDAANNTSGASAGFDFVQEASLVAPEILSPTAGTKVDGPSITVTGTAYPNSSVTVSDQDGVICTATTDAAGNYTCTGDIAGGVRTLTASAKFKGFQNASTPVEVTVLMQVGFVGGGCGCSTGGTESAWMLLLVGAAMLRRRFTRR